MINITSRDQKKWQDKWVIGLMSGTSCDGIDVAFLKTDGESIFEYGPFYSFPYDDDLRTELLSIMGVSKRESCKEVEDILTDKHIDVVKEALRLSGIDIKDVACVGCHGQTVFHAPHLKRTLQIIDGERMALSLGVSVVYDFRRHDVSLGGQGAPLVPIFHKSVGKDFPKPFLFLNIGGVANMTLVTKDDIYACDVGPGNAPVDDLMGQYFGEKMDKNGEVSQKGRLDMEAVASFLKHPFFKKEYPKSLDRNEFSSFSFKDGDPQDRVATTAAFMPFSLLKNLKFLPEKPLFCVVSGGGIYNQAMMKMLRILMPFPVMSLLDYEGAKGVDPDAVEAYAFAFLAVRVMRHLPTTFPHTTGCLEPLCGGAIAYPL